MGRRAADGGAGVSSVREGKLQVGPYEVAVWAAGGGDPLLYLHGYDGPPASTAFLERLAKTRRVIAPVHAGFVGSSDDADIHDVLNVVVFYQELLEGLGIERCDVVGHSLGGMFAAELAAVAPRAVKRLVLVDALGLWLDEQPIPDFIPLGGSGLNRLLWADPAVAASHARPLAASTPEAATTANVERTGNLGAATNYLWPIPERGLRPRLRRISAPTLLVWGAQDGVVGRAYAEEYQRLIAGSRLEIIEGAGHFPMLEQPEAFAHAVEAFLGG